MATSFDTLNKELLEEKKEKFYYFVKSAVLILGVDSPKVRFWKDYCPNSTSNEIAHIHLQEDPPIICISLNTLKNLSIEEIEDAAKHEVAHIKIPDHSRTLYLTIDSLKRIGWKPFSNATVINGNDSVEKEFFSSPKKIKSKKDVCNQHGCAVKNHLQKCTLYKDFFCKNHLTPLQPTISSDSDYLGHPCLKYSVAEAPHYFLPKQKI